MVVLREWPYKVWRTLAGQQAVAGCQVYTLYIFHLLQCIHFDTTIIILPFSRDGRVACSCCPSVKNPGTDSLATGHRSGPRSASSRAGSSSRPDSFSRREWSSLSCARPPDDVTNPDMTTTGPMQQWCLFQSWLLAEINVTQVCDTYGGKRLLFPEGVPPSAGEHLSVISDK